jgi:electron transfer flavoprotein alpha subunit
MSFASALAARLGLGFASDVHAIELREGAIVATRSFYGGKVAGEIEFTTATVLLTLRPTAWPQAAPRSGPPAPVTSTAVDVGRARVRHVRFERPETSQDVDISAADFLLAIGRGIGDGDAVRQFEDLAERMKATLCASRPLVDAGWMPASRQVGQSGKTVKPKVYLAFGISGAVQHLAGMRGAGTVIAVNTDPDAAIFGVADYAARCDLFDVADALEQLW